MKQARVVPIAILSCLGLLSTTARSEQAPTPAPADTLIRTSARHIDIAHITLEVRVDFELFTQRLEALLGRFDPSALKTLPQTGPAAVEARLNQMEGDEGLMIFSVQNHGALLTLAGTPGRAKRYVIGSPWSRCG